MTYSVFEGKKSVRSVRKMTDKNFFKEMTKKLSFKKDIELVTFCVALAMRKEHQEDGLTKKSMTGGTKIAGMESFEKRELYDRIILDHLNIEEDRLIEFETYFYTGFNMLREWSEEYGPDANSEIERISSIWDKISDV